MLPGSLTEWEDGFGHTTAGTGILTNHSDILIIIMADGFMMITTAGSGIQIMNGHRLG